MTLRHRLFAFVALVLASPHLAAAAPGDPDATFATGGIYKTDFNTPLPGARQQRVVIDAQNRPVVAMTVQAQPANTSVENVVVMRFTTSGILDTSFNPTGPTPGLLQLDFLDPCSDLAEAKGIALTPDGHIVVLADLCASTLGSYTGLVRLDDTGGYDNGFSGNGRLALDYGAPSLAPVYMEDVEVDSSDRIYVGGTRLTQCSGTCTGTRGVVARFTSAGVLDSTYNAAGTNPGVFELAQVVSNSDQRVQFFAIALTPDEHIVAAGNVNLAGGVVARVLENGTLDSTFNPSGSPAGTVQMNLGASGTSIIAQALGVAVGGDDSVVITGQAITSGVSRLVVAKLGATGQPDAGFAVGGPESGVGHHPTGSRGEDVVLEPGGKILVVGKGNIANGVFLARYDTSGQLDPTFKPGSNPAGTALVVVVASGNDSPTDLVLDGDGRIVTVGATIDPGQDPVYAGFVIRVGGGGSAGPTPTVTPTPLPAPICAVTPAAGCRQPVVSGKAALFMKRASGDPKAQLAWSWVKGAATTKADFGNPVASDTYQLCVYDGTPSLIASATAPAGGFCGPVRKPKPCWKATKTGFVYADKELTPSGLQSLKLKAGVAGKATIALKGKGVALGLPAIPLLQPVTVQLRNSSGVCWEATYGAPAKKNTAGPPPQFKDKAD